MDNSSKAECVVQEWRVHSAFVLLPQPKKYPAYLRPLITAVSGHDWQKSLVAEKDGFSALICRTEAELPGYFKENSTAV